MKILKVAIIFLLLTIIFTYPLMIKINSYIPGFQSTDEPYAALWHFWWQSYSQKHHLNSTNINMIAAPFGKVLEKGYLYWNIINKSIAVATNPIFTYNIQVIFSYILSGLFAYFLAFFVLKNRIAALFSGIIFSFCPYHAVRTWQHLGLAQIQWMPLYLLCLLKLHKQMTIKNAVLVAVSFVLVASFDLYYAYFMFLITLIFTLFDFSYRKDFRSTFNLFQFFLVSVFLILLLDFYDFFQIGKFIFNLHKTHSGQGVFGYVRPFGDLFSQSARPLSYFLPSADHPFFGKFTLGFVGTSLYGESFTEHALYLGWIPLLLSILAFKIWKKRKKVFSGNFYFVFFVVLTVVSWLFSQPPWWNIFGFKLYMPSFFMYKIAPMYRAYARFGIVLTLALAVLSGFGLSFILEKFNSRNKKFAVAGLFSFLVLFEFWNYPPFKVIDVSKVPIVYYWLKEQPGDFIIAEYPLDSDSTNELYKFYQITHEKRIINGTIPGSSANKFAKTINKLSSIDTPGVLKWMGVKYVIVHKEDYFKTELLESREEPEKISKNNCLKLVKTFNKEECSDKNIMCVQETGEIDVYEITALAKEPEIK